MAGTRNGKHGQYKDKERMLMVTLPLLLESEKDKAAETMGRMKKDAQSNTCNI